jgi:dTDP-4-amino-4,6-dideoxygalactose transaminase
MTPEAMTNLPVAVPLLDLKAQYAAIREEVRAAVERVLESQHFILGPEVEALEHEIAAYSQCTYGIGVSSGTDALLVALMAIELKPGDEVITTPYTFFATGGCISRLGARPVFVDIEPASFNLNPNQIEAAITPRTKAIMPVHLFGQMAEMDPILDIAQRHDLYVIEDAAQAIGAEYNGRRAGSLGHMGCFSFFPSKNLGAAGDAGLVTTNDERLAQRVRLLRSHGAQPKYHHQVVGGNFRLDEIQAAILRVKMKYLETWTERRRQNAARYRQLLNEAGERLGDRLILPEEQAQRRHIFNQFVVRCERRNDLMAFLKEQRIGCEVYYPVPLHLQTCFKDLGYGVGDFPHSETAAQESLAVPVYPELTESSRARVVAALVDFYRDDRSH